MNSAVTTGTIVQEITINATAQRVFEALISPEARLKWWWSAQGSFRLIRVESDLRPGGKWSMHGIGKDEKPLSVSGQYHEIEPPHLLIFSWLPDWQEDKTETLVRWDLEEKNGVTKVRLTHSGFASESIRATYQGWPYILGNLQSYIREKDDANLRRPTDSLSHFGE